MRFSYSGLNLNACPPCETKQGITKVRNQHNFILTENTDRIIKQSTILVNVITLKCYDPKMSFFPHCFFEYTMYRLSSTYTKWPDKCRCSSAIVKGV